jgi:hypothetical protein
MNSQPQASSAHRRTFFESAEGGEASFFTSSAIPPPTFSWSK